MTGLRTAFFGYLLLSALVGCDLETSSLGEDGTGAAGTGAAGTGAAGTGAAGTGGNDGANGGSAGQPGSLPIWTGGTSAGGAGALANELVVLPDQTLDVSYAGMTVRVTPNAPASYNYEAFPPPAFNAGATFQLHYDCLGDVPATLEVVSCWSGGNGCVSVSFDAAGSTGYFHDEQGRLRQLAGSLNVTLFGRGLGASQDVGGTGYGRAMGSFHLTSADALDPIVVDGTFTVWIVEMIPLC